MLPPVDDNPGDPNLRLRVGDRELLIRDRYETASIVNDALIAVEFFVGSFFFFGMDKDPGVWLFVVGSAQLAIRPTLRLARRVSLRRMQRSADAHRDDAYRDDDAQDF